MPRFRPLTPFPRAHRAPAQLGHAAGDELLTAIAGRLGNCVRPTHSLIRIGDAGFAILLEQAASRDEAIDLAERINRRLAERFSVAGQSMSVRASTGIANGRVPGPPRRLIRTADVAMYQAKQGGEQAYRPFESGMEVPAPNRPLDPSYHPADAGG